MLRMPNERSHIAARNVKAVKLTKDQAASLARNPHLLESYGIRVNMDHIAKMQAADNAANPLNPTVASSATPVQFLQNWLVGQVHNVTAARKIDMLVGVTTQGNWEDEEIVQTVLEMTGETNMYTDYGNSQLANWNTNFERRTVVRAEAGIEVGKLEEARAGRMQVNSAESKRYGASEALEIFRNRIGFFGYNNGDNRTFGFLNDPSLLPYINAAAGASGGTEWSTKTFQEIKNDLLGMADRLRTQSGERIDPESDPITLALATTSRNYLAQTTDFGISVKEWIQENYPNWRIESAPELVNANGGASVGYMYAEEVTNSGTDDKRTFIQVVPTKFVTLGVMQKTKSYEEDYSNATAGVMCKRPYAVTRISGI